MTGKLLGENVENVYQDILQSAIEIVPGAQAGSVLVREQDRFKYVAAVGFDLEGLRTISFSVEEQETCLGEMDFVIRIVGMARSVDTLIKDERLDVLKKSGRLDEIKSTLIIPIRIGKELRLTLNLDNMEREDAFGKISIKIAKLLANLLAVIFNRLELEKRIQRQKEELERMSYHDSLTNLPNRRMFDELSEKMLSLAKRENRELSILFLDLSGFKRVNDVHGHLVGDEVLKVTASRIAKCLRAGDLVCRFGGDEFLVLAYDCSKENAKTLAGRLIQAIEEPIELKGVTLNISTEVGISSFPEDGNSVSELVRKADEALYRAKRHGLKVVVANP
ncbi:GGDEF domain-containing protein [Pseudothermotoga hypogea]|uniref:GGDEF domain-containing protein n=1 Tax=Pseudothermotoga hypogea TaxID=57487 RepID=UPI0012B66CB2|nr:sensor domain-containing diguanylate cyclase [Pseudothermotoga hypogea]